MLLMVVDGIFTAAPTAAVRAATTDAATTSSGASASARATASNVSFAALCRRHHTVIFREHTHEHRHVLCAGRKIVLEEDGAEPKPSDETIG
jgi:hypothetical protein